MCRPSACGGPAGIFDAKEGKLCDDHRPESLLPQMPVLSHTSDVNAAESIGACLNQPCLSCALSKQGPSHRIGVAVRVGGCCCRSFPAKPNMPHVLSIATCPDTQSKGDGVGDPEGLVLAGIEVGSAQGLQHGCDRVRDGPHPCMASRGAQQQAHKMGTCWCALTSG